MSDCKLCGGSGVLINAVNAYDGLYSFDADHIVRCDSCQQFDGDLQAARAVAAMQINGSWLVWAENLGGGLPSTELSNIYVRCSACDATCLQLAILQENQDEPDVPNVFVHVEYVPQGVQFPKLEKAILPAEA